MFCAINVRCIAVLFSVCLDGNEVLPLVVVGEWVVDPRVTTSPTLYNTMSSFRYSAAADVLN